ncbi:MAG: M15 family metallopeptidase [Chloroflexia bacterium]|nr:M15 family metallopeptidase [Chloroflexia bacterium]
MRVRALPVTAAPEGRASIRQAWGKSAAWTLLAVVVLLGTACGQSSKTDVLREAEPTASRAEPAVLTPTRSASTATTSPLLTVATITVGPSLAVPRHSSVPTSQPTPTPTLERIQTPTPLPTDISTPHPTATRTPRPTPTSTRTPRPAATSTLQPPATSTPRSTATIAPRPTSTATPTRAATPTPRPTAVFSGMVAPIGPETRQRIGWSWRPGCPVPPEDLRLLTVDHWGFDGAEHRGELIVQEDEAQRVLAAMRMLFDARFPIQRMLLVDEYEGDDDRSMAANNTSAFNCRAVTGQPGVWSEHSYGRALDINPMQNPYVLDETVLPADGTPFADRSRNAQGMIHPDGPVVRAFAAIGWSWGGYWRSPTDYQHFSATGR